MPRDDWPPTAKRADRLPAETRALGDERLAVGCIRVFKLTPLQADVFALLLKRNEAYKTSIHAVIEGRRLKRQNKPANMEETELKMVDVIICNLRKKLKKHSIKIKTLWGKGYCMDKVDRDRALSMLAEYHKSENGETNGGEGGDITGDVDSAA
jgi:DNA-binding winged helix-turn-helix (wHTH) protein